MSANTPSTLHTRKPFWRSTAAFLLLVVLLIAGSGIGWRIYAAEELSKKTNDNATASVVVMKAPSGPSSEEIVLPGNVQAWHDASIFARTSGYLKDWKTDIGAHVKAGDVLADIDTPEVDAQLHQAQADLATAEANNALAQVTAKRWQFLLKTNSVSKQETDEKVSAASAQAATVASARANVDRLQQMEIFKQVVAPFDGVITARNTDIGALINAGSTASPSQELFHIVERDKLRIYVQVPEIYTTNITPDITADLVFAEHPGEKFEAHLLDTAKALDATSRTLLAEFSYDNSKGVLLPGGYAEVHLKLPAQAGSVRLPVSALIFRANGLQVATVDSEGHAILKTVKMGRDFGNTVEIVSGITAGETIVTSPPDSLVTGEAVHVVTPQKDASKNGSEKHD
jgi:RND family efflux transporter MFP subunit